jgi:hypothetical protein
MEGMKIEYKDLDEVVVKGEGVIDLHFSKPEGLTLEVKCLDDEGKTSSAERDKLLKLFEKCDQKLWVHKYDPTPKGAFDHLVHSMKHGGPMHKIHGILEFIIDFILTSTLFWCDVKDVKKENRWPILFCMSMIWLAFFSWAMVQVMGFISDSIPFLTSLLLGVTLGAIGTSLPNAMGSVIMASQGKSAAAIGNAFGSNVQNVFLAMAGPWIIYILAQDPSNPCSEKFPGDDCVDMSAAPVAGKHGQTIAEGVCWMIFTLILVVFFALLPITCSFNKFAGFVFVAVYVCYLAWTVIEFSVDLPWVIPGVV